MVAVQVTSWPTLAEVAGKELPATKGLQAPVTTGGEGGTGAGGTTGGITGGIGLGVVYVLGKVGKRAISK